MKWFVRQHYAFGFNKGFTVYRSTERGDDDYDGTRSKLVKQVEKVLNRELPGGKPRSRKGKEGK